MSLRRYNPAVESHWLLLASGAMWSAVGAMLCLLAYGWLQSAPPEGAGPLGAAGALAALVVYRLGFSRLAARNVRRIAEMTGRRCLFAFQAWRGYLIIALMMALGLALRASPIPKPYLAVLYVGIGGGLLLASLRYYRYLAAALGLD